MNIKNSQSTMIGSRFDMESPGKMDYDLVKSLEE